MKTDRWFFSAVGASFLVIMLVGFRWFITTGHGNEGRPIGPSIFRLDLVHGLAIAAWFLLFFAQSLLITVKNRRLHFKLGWAAVAVGLTILITGSLVAVRSVQVTPRDFHFLGMLYSRFLLVMLTEVWLFTAFVATGILARKKPRIHRPAMVMASLCLLGGATVRISFLHPLFGATGEIAHFGPVFCIGAILFLVRCLLNRQFDRWFAAEYAIFVFVISAAEKLALTDGWAAIAASVLKL